MVPLRHPISVYVSAGKVPIEAPGNVVFKDLAHLGISKHGARFAPAPPLGQGAALTSLIVVYQALYGERGTWVRPAVMFTEVGEVAGRRVPRFTRIGDA